MNGIDKNSVTPLYLQLAEIIRADIKSGAIKPGEKLSSEPQLMKKYNVARMTVRNALSKLVNEDIIEKHHGKGSFVKRISPKKNIDVLLNMSDHYFLPYNLQGISSIFNSNNAVLVAGDTKNSNIEIVKLLNNIADRGSDGIILQGSPAHDLDKTAFYNTLLKLKEKDIPFIIIDFEYDFSDVCHIAMNEENIGKIAGLHLKEMGHKKISAVLIGEDDLSFKRYKGLSLVYKDVHIINFDYNTRINILKDISCGTTAFFCYNDTIAQKCIDILKEENINVPNDVSIIGVDDTIIADAYNITSVAHAKGLIAKYAAESILKRKFKTKMYNPEITLRSSVKNIN